MKTKTTTKYMQSRMDNPEKLVTSGKQDEDKQSQKHNTESWTHEEEGPHKKPEMNPDAL